MPNYRYNSPDYMRRGNQGRQNRSSYNCSSGNYSSGNYSSDSHYSESTHYKHCEKKSDCDELHGMTLAMAYIPWQEWQNLYDADQGLHKGTIFSELDKPFLGTGGCCR